MPLLDAFLSAIADRKTGQVNPLKIAQMVGNIAGDASNFSDPRAQALLTQLVGPWALGVARAAPSKWLLPTNVPPSCALELGSKLCGQFAIGGCHCCGRPICLGHAMVASDATLACWACMRLGAKHASPWAPPGAAAGASAIQWAYDLLGLKNDCTVEDAKHAYKQRVARFHSDRVEKGQDPKPNDDLVRTLKSAYDAIVKDKERST